MRFNIAMVADRAGLRPEFIQAFLQTVVDILADGDEVFLEGFGAFRQFTRRARRFKSKMVPGGVAVIAEGTTARFRAAPKFRRQVNRG